MKKTISKFNKEDKNIIFTQPNISNEMPKTKKIILRLIPHSKASHQIMMKLSNFPRLELKFIFANYNYIFLYNKGFSKMQIAVSFRFFEKKMAK